MPDPVFALTLCPTVKKVNAAGAVTASLAPLANAVATPASAASGQTVALSALTSSDPNTPARPLTFHWAQTGGPAVVLAGGNTATPSFNAPNVTANTTLTFNVKVMNTVPLTRNATVSVSVNPPSAPPSASINAPANAVAGSTVNLVGVVSNGAAFKWTQTAGPVVVLSASTSLSPSFIA